MVQISSEYLEARFPWVWLYSLLWGLWRTFELFYEATIGIGWLAYEGFSWSFLARCIVAYRRLLVSRFCSGNWGKERVDGQDGVMCGNMYLL